MDAKPRPGDPVHRIRSEKAVLRRAGLRRRAARTDAERASARAGIAATLRRLPSLVPVRPPGAGPTTVCSYLPLGSEPLPPDAAALLAAAGMRVLLPVTRPGMPLDWREWRPGAETRPAAYGLDEVTGPDLGAGAIRQAAAVLVPALLVDGSGRRLGRGGGYYDRSLALLDGSAAAPLLIAVLFDDELVPDPLPVEPFDVPVRWVVTPAGGPTELPAGR